MIVSYLVCYFLQRFFIIQDSFIVYLIIPLIYIKVPRQNKHRWKSWLLYLPYLSYWVRSKPKARYHESISQTFKSSQRMDRTGSCRSRTRHVLNVRRRKSNCFRQRNCLKACAKLAKLTQSSWKACKSQTIQLTCFWEVTNLKKTLSLRRKKYQKCHWLSFVWSRSKRPSRKDTKLFLEMRKPSRRTVENLLSQIPDHPARSTTAQRSLTYPTRISKRMCSKARMPGSFFSIRQVVGIAEASSQSMKNYQDWWVRR